MPGKRRKRKAFEPAEWVEPTSDNEWLVSSIPSVLDRGAGHSLSKYARPQNPQILSTQCPQSERGSPQNSEILQSEPNNSALFEPSVDITDDEMELDEPDIDDEEISISSDPNSDSDIHDPILEVPEQNPNPVCIEDNANPVAGIYI